MPVISLRIQHSAGGMSAKQYSVCTIPKISVGCAWSELSNHICILPQGDILCTIGFFIDRCPDKVLLEEVKRVLIPIQMGEVEAKPIFSPSIGEVVAYQLRQQPEAAGDGGAGL